MDPLGGAAQKEMGRVVFSLVLPKKSGPHRDLVARKPKGHHKEPQGKPKDKQVSRTQEHQNVDSPE